jgi:glycosyltransferase involved in cell wall biosynthesis
LTQNRATHEGGFVSPGSELPKRERLLTGFLHHRRKLHVGYPIHWNHHRGGWNDVTDVLVRDLGCADGILTVNALEETIVTGRVLDVPWVGFSHEVPHHSYVFPDLTRLLQLDTWKASMRHCRGLWVLSSHNKKFLESCGLPFPVSFVHYPVTSPEQTFSFDSFTRSEPRRLVCIGEYLRRIQPFFDLVAPGYDKILLDSPEFRHSVVPKPGPQPVSILGRVSDEDYDGLLARSVVFLNLIDAGANTTIVECIVRCTPILVNRVGGVSEYLGDDYPLYYETLEEAAAKLADMDLLARTTLYLKTSGVQERLTFDHFKQSIENTAVYRNIPLPPSQRSNFLRFDLTVMICTYRRIACLDGLLDRLTLQEFPGTFEVLIWNNNFEACDEIQAIVEPYKSRLSIRVIHSTDNLYCGPRLAAPALMRSEQLMICDDDVMPEPNYLKTFWDKHLHYGPRSIICARGHAFLPHRLDTDNPERVWTEQKFLTFHDEFEDDREIHLLHADNCLLSRDLLLEASRVGMAAPDYVLVDDYWLSYALMHTCGCRIWKIKANEAFRFHPSADDARIAMSHSSLVREQLVNFYIYHTQRGWPFPQTQPKNEQSAVMIE